MQRTDKQILDLIFSKREVSLRIEKKLDAFDYEESLNSRKLKGMKVLLSRGNFRSKSIFSERTERFVLEFFLNVLSNCEALVATKSIQGFRNKEVANILCVAEKTVKFHLGNVFRRLRISNRVQLIWVLPIFKKGIVSLKPHFDMSQGRSDFKNTKFIREFLENKDYFTSIEQDKQTIKQVTERKRQSVENPNQLSAGIKKVVNL